MTRLRAVALFWWDFVVGDDWRMAVAVVLSLVAVGVLTHAGIAAWWVVPPVVVGVLALSLHRALPGR